MRMMKQYHIACLMSLVFFSFQAVSNGNETNSSKDEPVLLKGENAIWAQDKISFTVKLGTGTGDYRLKKDEQKNFKFDLTCGYRSNSSDTTSKIRTFPFSDLSMTSDSEYEAHRKKSDTIFYTVKNVTKLDSTKGTYHVEIKMGTKIGSKMDAPKSFSDLDKKKELSIKVTYGSKTMIVPFVKNDDVTYALGNTKLIKSMVFSSAFRKVIIKPAGGSKDPALTFTHKAPGLILDNAPFSEALKTLDFVAFEVDGKTDNTDFKTVKTGPATKMPILAYALDLLVHPTGSADGKGTLKTKNDENLYWDDLLKKDLGSVVKDQCYFVYPPTGKTDGQSYECVRCNFDDPKNTTLSQDKAYLISSSSFNSTNKVSAQTKFVTGFKSAKAVEVKGLVNNKLYAILPLFNDKTMIRYNSKAGDDTHKDPEGNKITGLSGHDSKVMCRLFSPKRTQTFGEALGLNESGTVEGDPRCFIATAAYGSPFAKQVDMFRWFRDEFILKTSLGESFMDFYYTNSEPIADFIAKSEVLKFVVRLALWPFAILVHILKLVMELSLLWLVTAAGALFVFGFSLRYLLSSRSH